MGIPIILYRTYTTICKIYSHMCCETQITILMRSYILSNLSVTIKLFTVKNNNSGKKALAVARVYCKIIIYVRTAWQ